MAQASNNLIFIYAGNRLGNTEIHPDPSVGACQYNQIQSNPCQIRFKPLPRTTPVLPTSRSTPSQDYPNPSHIPPLPRTTPIPSTSLSRGGRVFHRQSPPITGKPFGLPENPSDYQETLTPKPSPITPREQANVPPSRHRGAESPRNSPPNSRDHDQTHRKPPGSPENPPNPRKPPSPRRGGLQLESTENPPDHRKTPRITRKPLFPYVYIYTYYIYIYTICTHTPIAYCQQCPGYMFKSSK